MREEVKVPRLRLKDFEDHWMRHNLSDIACRVTRKNQKQVSDLALTISAEKGLVDQYEIFNSRVAAKDTSNYFLIKRGEFAYNHSTSDGHPYGAIKRLDKYPCGVLSTLYIVFALVNDVVDSDYLVHYYSTSLWHRDVQLRAAEGARNHGLLNISAVDFLNTGLRCPISVEEQRKIGQFHDCVEQVLSSRSEALEKLQVLKKSMLANLFPQGDAKVPKIRFKGFEGEWDEKKLSSYLSVSQETNDDLNYTADDVKSVSGEFGVVNQIEHLGRSFAGASVRGYHVLRRGQMVYTKSPLKANPFGIVKVNRGADGIVSVLYGVYNVSDDCDADFVQVFFESNPRLNNYLRPLVNKGAKNTLLISDEDAIQGLVAFPRIEEQRKISAYFKALDNLIAARRYELMKLKQMKSALLERMFV